MNLREFIQSEIKSQLSESVNEEQLDEKLITFSNRAPYGQVVFMAGGAGSGKGFAIDNFIDAAGFKVRDVDEMKKAVGKLDQLGKFSVDKWYKKYGNKLKPKDKEHVEEFVLGKGMTIADVAADLKNPNNVMSLHLIVDAMGLKDKWLINMLKGKQNKETLPNLLFDITAKKVGSITSVIKPLVDAGYDPKNIHLIWVLTNYHLAVKQNKERSRVVPDDILLLTHEGAAKTIWGILTGGLPKGLNGRIDVILNNRENTITYKDSKGNEMKGAVKGFKSLPIKKQGGGITAEKEWKKQLYGWILDNGPKTVDLRKPLDTQMEESLSEAMSIAARKKLARKSKSKLKRGMKKRIKKMKKKRSNDDLQKAALRKAKTVLMQKMLKKAPADMTMMDKMKFSKMLAKKPGKIQKVAKKILPKLKQAESDRVKKMKARNTQKNEVYG